MENVFIATDDERIVQAVSEFGGQSVLTSSHHVSGTDRCAEAARILDKQYNFDIVVNVQGDEPFLQQEQLELLMGCFSEKDTDIATLITPIKAYEILNDSNKVKAVKAVNGNALYFSRHPIPFQRDVEQTNWLDHHNYYLHLGMYAYRKEALQQITQLQPTALELTEKLEQLRWLENGYKIKTALTSHPNFGVDTPSDLEALLQNKPFNS
jgi:3-deoxy-manno-octulosonate cytidylyltransferase (CMP-KDO synthetase)